MSKANGFVASGSSIAQVDKKVLRDLCKKSINYVIAWKKLRLETKKNEYMASVALYEALPFYKKWFAALPVDVTAVWDSKKHRSLSATIIEDAAHRTWEFEYLRYESTITLANNILNVLSMNDSIGWISISVNDLSQLKSFADAYDRLQERPNDNVVTVVDAVH